MKARKGNKARLFFKQTILIINYLFIGALIISYTASWINPSDWWLPAFMGLGYPFLVIANLVFVIFWLIAKKWYFLLSLITILVGWNSLFSNIQFNRQAEPAEYSESFRVMSFNARLFRIFNVAKDEITETDREFLNLLDEIQPGIICFQEFYSNPYNEHDMLSILAEEKGYEHYHLDDFLGPRHGIHQGLAIFSKYPIINRDRYQFRNSTNNYIIFSDMVVHGDTLRFYNLHFESIRLDKHDYLFIDELTSNRKNEHNWVESVKMIYWKLKLAFEKRSIQVNQAVEQLKKSPYPLVLCGDFNDTPASYVYYRMTKLLNDAFVNAGNGFGRSYAGAMPSYRIDFIMYDEPVKPLTFETLPVDISDHYPLISDFHLNKE